MERIADTIPVYLMHLIYTCVLEQHFICCAISGEPECETLTILIQDISHPSPFSYYLPESLATACGLSHNLRHLKQFDPNDVFLNEYALRHIIDFRTESYSGGNYDYNEDLRFLKTFECPAQIYARSSYCTRPGHEWLIDGGGALIYSNWGSYRYFLLFICVKTNYTVIYYLKDKSTRSFVAALKYVDRLVRVRKD